MNKVVKVYLGADHGGYKLKEVMKGWLGEMGYEFEDCGAFEYDPQDDYPDFAFAVAKRIREANMGVDQNDEGWLPARAFGIVGCRSAAGVLFTANKVGGVRAAAAFDKHNAAHMRANDDCNVLAVPGDWFDEKKAKGIIEVFLKTEFSMEERHIRRLRKVREIERELFV